MTYLSVIIPAHNEADRLPRTIREVVLHLMGQDYRSEIIVVENGSSDETTEVAWREISQFAGQIQNVRGRVVHSLPGKGAAIQTGMLQAQGTMLYMCDADLSTPIEFVKRFIPPEFEGDIGIGSRNAPGGHRYNEPLSRKISGRIFNTITRTLLPEISDTQCGFKMFRREAARDLFTRMTITGWAFDVEILFLAKQLGYEVEEVGVPWYYNGDSRVKVIRDSLHMARDIFRIWLANRSGDYEPEKDLIRV